MAGLCYEDIWFLGSRILEKEKALKKMKIKDKLPFITHLKMKKKKFQQQMIKKIMFFIEQNGFKIQLTNFTVLTEPYWSGKFIKIWQFMQLENLIK